MIIPIMNTSLTCDVDEEDYFFIFPYSWHLSEYGYAFRSPRGEKTQYIHIIIALRMGFSGKIDHKDRNRMNNRRSNLRMANNTQNAANSRLRSDNTSGYRGVSWDSNLGKWRAYIRFKGVKHNIGCFNSKENAALAYDNMAVKRFGEFAVLNFPKVPSVIHVVGNPDEHTQPPVASTGT